MNDLKARMLQAGKFHVDGWTSQRGRDAVAELVREGLIICTKGGSDEEQYTCLNCTVSEEGEEALRDHLQKHAQVQSPP